jgi:hypothetical protein
MSTWLLVLGVLMLLWSTPIGPEDLPSDGVPTSAVPRPLTAPKPPTKPVSAKKIDRKKLHFGDLKEIDQEVFMREFKYQAERDGLFACLNASLPSPRSLLLEALILRSGVVTRMERSGPVKALPQCASDLLIKMKFPQSGATLESESHTVIWRVDW